MEKETQDTCLGVGSLAGAVIGTFFTTILLLSVAVLLLRQWRRHKGKHLVLVTDPEIVEDAYAFDNPCFKDATPSNTRALDRPVQRTVGTLEPPGKDPPRWSTSWASLALSSTNRNDKRRTLDDSCLGPKATRISLVSLRSHDFTGLGFNVCGNMREGIFVKDLLHRGPASESGRIHPGDRIASIRISFRNMVYEDALTILSYASPYDVELEVESGGSGSKPTTLLKKSVGPSPNRICHPLYRSQSIPEFSQTRKAAAKRLFIADPNESIGSNYSTMNSTLRSSKSTPGTQTLERHHEEATSAKSNHHHRFGIKVLPVLDGTVHRAENQNEHNTNLERRNSRKIETEKKQFSAGVMRQISSKQRDDNIDGIISGNTLKNLQGQNLGSNPIETEERNLNNDVNIPSVVPTEVHNAAMAAQRNRRNSTELLNSRDGVPIDGTKSPQKGKRKAPAPPKANCKEDKTVPLLKRDSSLTKDCEAGKDDAIDSIADYVKICEDDAVSVADSRGTKSEMQQQHHQNQVDARDSESDTDSEVQNSFTTIELNPADITIHRTPIPAPESKRDERVEVEQDEDDEDDMYRKAASLGDLSKYECKTSSTLERAQSLDMTDTCSKKRKAPLPPEDINESTEDLTKLDQIDSFDRRKLKKSNQWGTLEDAFSNRKVNEEEWLQKGACEGQEEGVILKKPRMRKGSDGALERSKSAMEIISKDESLEVMSETVNDGTSIELYNLPLSKKLSQEFIRVERMFDPEEDNSLARIVNDGNIVKSPTLEEMELDFRQAKPFDDEPLNESPAQSPANDRDTPINEEFSRALRYFEMHSNTNFPVHSRVNLSRTADSKEEALPISYAGKEPVVEKPMLKMHVEKGCRACGKRDGKDEHCVAHICERDNEFNRVGEQPPIIQKRDAVYQTPKFYEHLEGKSPHRSESRITISKVIEREDDEDEIEYEFGSAVTVSSKCLSEREDLRDMNNVSVSSGENSEDSGLVGESIDYSHQELENRPPLPTTPMPQKSTYVTEIKVSTTGEPNELQSQDRDSQNEEVICVVAKEERKPTDAHLTPNGKSVYGKKPPVPPRKYDVVRANKDEHKKEGFPCLSEVKLTGSREPSVLPDSAQETKKEVGQNKFEEWIFLGEREQNRWPRSSTHLDTVTNILLSSRDAETSHQ